MQDVRQLTARGSAGVAVLELRSRAAEERLSRMFARPLPAAGGIAHGALRAPDTGEILDEVLVVRRPNGHLEVHAHGNQALADDLRQRLIAGPGPVTLEDRAWSSAAHAPTALGARILMEQARGALRAELMDLAALPPEAQAAVCARLAERGRRCARLFRRSTVVLVGPVNAGKSTLFNVLVGEDEALVSETPGTTRDVLGAPANLGLWPVVLVDTAGGRALDAAAALDPGGAQVEAEGMRLGREAAARADVTLHISSAGKTAPEFGAPAVSLTSRCAETLGSDPERWPAGGFSALEAPQHARRVVAAAFASALGLAREADALWVSGQAVPFEPELMDALEAMGSQRAVDPRTLDSLLASL